MKTLALLVLASFLLFGCTQPQPTPTPTGTPTVTATPLPTLTATPTKNPDDIPPFPEDDLASCKSDADCVPAGCNGEICTSKANAGNIASICVYKPEFACYKQISCGCVTNSCAWKETPSFRICIQDARNSGGGDLPPLPQ